MRIARCITGVGAVLAYGCGATATPLAAQAPSVPQARPLVLERNDGERRVMRPWPGHPRPGAPFILKIDPQNGGSSHLVVGTEDLPPGETIPPHRHPSADELFIVASGTARIYLGDAVHEVHAGATVFIPANTRISVSNSGKDPLSVVFIFSAPGFEDFMRGASVREGEKNLPMTPAEDDELQRKHRHDVIYE